MIISLSRPFLSSPFCPSCPFLFFYFCVRARLRVCPCACVRARARAYAVSNVSCTCVCGACACGGAPYPSSTSFPFSTSSPSCVSSTFCCASCPRASVTWRQHDIHKDTSAALRTCPARMSMRMMLARARAPGRAPGYVHAGGTQPETRTCQSRCRYYYCWSCSQTTSPGSCAAQAQGAKPGARAAPSVARAGRGAVRSRPQRCQRCARAGEQTPGKYREPYGAPGAARAGRARARGVWRAGAQGGRARLPQSQSRREGRAEYWGARPCKRGVQGVGLQGVGVKRGRRRARRVRVRRSPCAGGRAPRQAWSSTSSSTFCGRCPGRARVSCWARRPRRSAPPSPRHFPPPFAPRPRACSPQTCDTAGCRDRPQTRFGDEIPAFD